MEPWEPAGGCPPEAGGHIIVSTATRTGASSATRMTSSSWSTAARDDVARLREDIAYVLHPRTEAVTGQDSIVHMSDGFDFLYSIQWRRKRGSNKWYVYTFIAKRPIRS